MNRVLIRFSLLSLAFLCTVGPASRLSGQGGYDLGSSMASNFADVDRGSAPDTRGFVRPLSNKDEGSIPKTIEMQDKTFPAVLAHGLLGTEIDSWNAKPGDKVNLKLLDEIALPDGTVVAKGSKVSGAVEQVVSHGHASKNSALAIRFDTLTLKDKTEIPIVARLKVARQPPITGSTSVGMPGTAASGNVPNSGAGEGYYRVVPNIGPGAIVATNSDLQILSNTRLTLLVARATPPKN